MTRTICGRALRLALGIAATVALWISPAASSPAFAFQKPAFPRLAGLNIGQPFNYDDPQYQAALAREHIVILGMFPGLTPGGRPIGAAVQAIKNINPATLVFLYVNANELNYDPSGNSSVWDGVQSKVDSMRWWLYSDPAMTQKVTSAFGPGYFAVNSTMFTPRDGSGDNALEWITKFFVNNYVRPNPAVDGLFMDNTFWRTHVDGDWQRNGRIEPAGDPAASQWLRQGYARYFSLVRQLGAGRLQLANVTDWGESNSVLDEYRGLVNGGVMEGMVGKGWSPEAYAGWGAMMDRYRRTMANLAEPKLGIFNQWGDPGDFQAMRYGLASCLLGDAYYSFTSNATAYAGVTWFDEFNVSLGAGSFQPHGPWQSGVWRRDFDNGIVLVNPRGNGPQTVTLETPYVRLHGVQDPVTNSGQTVTRVTLQDRDGLILLRKAPLQRPKAPDRVTIGP